MSKNYRAALSACLGDPVDGNPTGVILSRDEARLIADIAKEYDKRATYYQNLFDPASGFMRGKDVHGNMAAEFDPCTWGGEYTEGSAWQNSFAVPHDIEGLAALHGGKEKLISNSSFGL